MKYIKRGKETNYKEVGLRNLGVTSHEELNDWFRKSRAGQYKVEGMTDVKNLLLQFKEKTVVVVGDYDCDGVTATEIITSTLQVAGFKNVEAMFPYRHTEGYGINCRIVDDIHNKFGDDICLLTVDNGIAAHSALTAAKNYGFTIIVMDHHLGTPNPENEDEIILPPADIIIDPAAFPDTADWSKYCGAGLAYKLSYEFLGKDAKIYQPLAAVATIADVMPLREENYVIVRDGLDALSKGFATPGLKAICTVNELTKVTAENVGFTIAPIINSAGRLYPNGGYRALEVLHADRFHAEAAARTLVDCNNHRKELVSSALKMAESYGDFSEDENIIIINLDCINTGIVGIVAGNLCEKWNRPVICFSTSEADSEMLTGSARSIDGINIKTILDKCAKYIHHYGGHEGAAGLSVEKNLYKDFVEAIKAEMSKIDKNLFAKPDEYYYDLEIPAVEVPKAIEAINIYEPFGEGNPAPVFKIVDFESTPYAGNYKSEIKGGGIRLRSKNVTAVGFGMAEAMKDCDGSKVTLYGNISFNRFRNTVTPQIQFDSFEDET